MLRERDWLPPPHVLVHAVYTLKAVTEQCTGQTLVLHALVSVPCAQTRPLYFDCCTTLREREREPEPQLLVHDVHGDQLLMTQCTCQR